MIVSELITLLQECPQDAQVILQKDAEGNGYSPLEGADDECMYVPESTWSGDVHSLENYEFEGYDEPKAVRCVVLFPVN